MLASTEGAGSPEIPGYKNPDFMSWLECLCKICCCYVSAALTAGILQLVPCVIINCLWSSVLWAVAVYTPPGGGCTEQLLPVAPEVAARVAVVGGKLN